MLTDIQIRFVDRQRVGRLATANRHGQPHVIPVCYVHIKDTFYIPLDAKPKRVAALQLKRVRNLHENPHVALVIDHYSDDWAELGYVLVRGTATLLPPSDTQHPRAVALLRDRYPQYQAMPIDSTPLIAIQVASVTAWGRLADEG